MKEDKMENIHLIFKFLWYSILFCIWGVSCTSSGTYKKTQMDIYMQYYDFIIDSLSKNPNYVCTRTARQMSFTTDSVAYCHYLVLLAKAYMFKSEMDSAKLSMDRAEVFCDGAEPSPLINDLYAEIYNMRGNVCVRQGLTDSSVVCFQKAFDYRLKGSNRDMLHDISINLADAFVRTGHYDKGAMWYRKALSYCDSLKIPEEKRFPVYYGLAQVYMELRDFTSCDYYYELAARQYDKMLPFEKHIYLNNRGNSYYFRADYPNALEFFRKSLLLARSYPDMIFEEHLTEMNLGETFLLMNQVDSAAYYLNLCSDFFRSIENQTALYYLDTQLIELALKQKIFIQQKENEVLALNQTLYLWMFACICILGLAVFVYTYNKRQRFLLQMRSQNMIATLRMENIRNRVSPHFIFNILNREMGNYTDEQVGNMRGLVKLMRRNLELTEQLCVTMAEELDFVNTFINLEREALGDSFILSTSIDAAIHLDQEILPSMMIQIPIENAIKHALKDKEGMKRLWVDIRKTGEGICVKVRDNGGGYRVNSANYGTGTGIKVILQTIQLLNANNKKHIDISITNVQLEDGETGCEFAVFLPHGYDYNLKKMV